MKRLLFSVIAVALIILGLNGVDAPAAAQSSDLTLRLTVTPSEVQQGRSAVIRVLEVNGQEIDKANATFLGSSIELHPSLDGDWIGFLAVDMDATRGDQLLDVYVWANGSDQPQRQTITVPVIWGAFTFQNVTINGDLLPLLDSNTNRAEINKLVRVHQRTTNERLFNYFIRPVGETISDFGGIRNYNNETLRGRHTGMDFRANTGDAVVASADGRVIMSERLPIHGNHIVIDHGWGILTGYSHLSERLVVPGQLVRQGETIGLVGATGRVEGPHLHFEVIINGYWVEPIQFLSLDIPPSLPSIQ